MNEVGLLLFGLSTELYALRIEEAAEVIGLPRFAPVPRMPPYLLGVCFRRGYLLPILDLGQRLGLRASYRRGAIPSVRSDRPAVVVARAERGEVGLLVDRIVRVARVPESAIQRSAQAPFTWGSVLAANEPAQLLDLESVGLDAPDGARRQE